MIVTLIVGATLSGVLMYKQLQADAYSEVMATADLMLDSAMSVRRYTIEQVRPHLDQAVSQKRFLPQSVPAYGATEVVNYIQETRPEYSYKEAVINPTNLRDKANAWELNVIQGFRRQELAAEASGIRHLNSGGTVLWLARPIKIENSACLVCHSTPERAPATMIKRYGAENGFGWQLNEIVGAQIVQVPANVAFAKSRAAFQRFLAWLVGVFACSLVILNLLLQVHVNRRVEHLTEFAEAVSRGDAVEQFAEGIVVAGEDELGQLAKAIGRMERSHSKSIDIIQSQAVALRRLERSTDIKRQA
jgi:protein-histidine pros-kinase